MMDRLANLLPSWLTEHLGAQDERGVWWIDGEVRIEQVGVGRQASYFAQTFGPDHGATWEREFGGAAEVMQFVKTWERNARIRAEQETGLCTSDDCPRHDSPPYECECGSQAFREEQGGWQCQTVRLDADGEVIERGELYFVDDGNATIVCADCGDLQ